MRNRKVKLIGLGFTLGLCLLIALRKYKTI